MFKIVGGSAASHCPNPRHKRGTFGCGDDSPGVQEIEQVRALKAVVVSREQGVADSLLPFRLSPAVEELLGLLLMQVKFSANGLGIAATETILRELLLLCQTYVAIGFVI